MSIAYIGIGSNMGDRSKNIEQALHLLETKGITLIKQSTIIETDPVGGPKNQRKFLNGVIKIKSPHSPHDLLDHLKDIEKQLGRIKTSRNGPRPIDLDILLFNGQTINDTKLTIPHPRMLDRTFVMGPLLEIEPDWTKEDLYARL